MSISDLFQDDSGKDATWKKAYAVVAKQLPVPSHVWRLVRCGWQAQADAREFLKILGFTRINPHCLLDAAELTSENPEIIDVNQFEKAIQILGLRYSAVVMAVNYVCRTVLNGKPVTGYKRLLEDLMKNIEIGYKVGARTMDLGLEGGALLGFSTSLGLLLLLLEEPKAIKEWILHTKDGARVDKATELKLFECEHYQVAALALQQLGFGHEMAIGTCCAHGGFDADSPITDRSILRWKAGYQWIEALKGGRNYPGDVEMRNFFKELCPPAPNAPKNLTLDVLYTEVNRVRREGSNWIWHLPKKEILAPES